MLRIVIALLAACVFLASSHGTLISDNLGAGAYSASGQYGSLAAANAFDGDAGSAWNAGGFAGNWIEVNLGQSYSVEALSLLVNQSPNGNTVHEVWMSSLAMQWNLTNATLAHTFNGYTTNGETLNATLSSPIMAQYVQIRTSQTPSWVSWREIEVYSAAAAIPEPSSFLLFCIGALAIWGFRLKRT